VPITRMLPAIVLLSVLLALIVCALAWLLTGRPSKARARHGVEPSRMAPLDLASSVPLDDDLIDDRDLRPRILGPDDDPEFIRELARVIAERGGPDWSGEAPPQPPGGRDY
jgi:hypothetical protein